MSATGSNGMMPLINRELSMLAFNERVLAQCELPWVPALERLRYLTIVSANLDEFYEVRMAEQKERLTALTAQRSPESATLRTMLQEVSTRANILVERKYELLNSKILPSLREVGIDLVSGSELTLSQRRWVQVTFTREIAPVLTPIGLDPSHPFPAVANKGLHFIVELRSKRGASKNSIAIVKVPRSLPRLFEIKDKTASTRRSFILLTTLIETELGRLFPGREVVSDSQFRVTRDSDLWVDEQEMTNLRHALAGELRRRPFGAAVRLEINADCSESITTLLLEHFDLEPYEVYRVNGPVNLARLQALTEAVDHPELRFKPFTPGPSLPEVPNERVFVELKRRDVLLHHPYQSFAPVVQFPRCAVEDPSVIAIKQTIYRTGSKSELMDLLIEAVRRGKEVTVVLELKARFDEETNINWADKLEQAGAHVVYGLVGLKTHAKMLLVLRKEGNAIRTYTHIGTGNYNPSTARFYTDFGLLTANAEIGKDVAAIFHHLTSLSQPPRLKHLWWAPHTMKHNLLAAIRTEARNAIAGKPAVIMAKMNALTDEDVMAALCEASNAGVRVQLIVRGACCLRPDVDGSTKNIKVRSIVGRFLEHSRIYYFENGGKPNVYISSADWMSRNLDRRVEVATPILDGGLRARVIDEGLNVALRDNTQAWVLQKNGAYRLLRPTTSQQPSVAQNDLATKLGQPSDATAT
ncbi:MAG TPA: polyphosphate kinase 1 [Casimicrobium sp.]|nr:polyphosphate kinase 1 [Casimicrobium sp.]